MMLEDEARSGNQNEEQRDAERSAPPGAVGR